MSDLASLKPDDFVILVHKVRRGPAWEDRAKMVRVMKVTRKCITVWAGRRFHVSDGSSLVPSDQARIRIPTEAEKAAYVEALALEQREREELKAYQAREDVQLAHRFASIDPERWLSLGLGRLREIAAWFEEVPR